MAEYNDGFAMGWLGRIYRYGKGVAKDIDLAKKWMQKATETKINWAKGEYIDLLWSINTKESDEEMFNYALPLAEKGIREIQGRVGRMYHNGRGTPIDLQCAAKWLRKASDQKINWAKNELFDVLWEIDTIESCKEMIEVATENAKAGDGGAMGRLGKAYRFGKGVEKNLIVAAEWMRKAGDKNIIWAKKELLDILWEIDTPETDKELFNKATQMSDKGYGFAMAKLGIAYLNGRGVEKNTNEAEAWFKKASNTGISWAKDEIKKIHES